MRWTYLISHNTPGTRHAGRVPRAYRLGPTRLAPFRPGRSPVSSMPVASCRARSIAAVCAWLDALRGALGGCLELPCLW